MYQMVSTILTNKYSSNKCPNTMKNYYNHDYYNYNYDNYFNCIAIHILIITDKSIIVLITNIITNVL